MIVVYVLFAIATITWVVGIIGWITSFIVAKKRDGWFEPFNIWVWLFLISYVVIQILNVIVQINK